MTTKSGYFIEDMKEGMSDSMEKTISEQDIIAFADLTGDDNPVHLDEAFAKSTIFKGCIAHGMLTASLISAVLGTRLPGPGCIYLSQSLRFRAPVRPGAHVVATLTVSKVDVERKRVTLDCKCTIGDRVVLDGEAVALVPSRAES
ncbi:MAG TPA: MaoC family dehydratase [Rhizobiales bacterium]|nr:MaoC family dehydratase [Hyphomicrobiales bacterium]